MRDGHEAKAPAPDAHGRPEEHTRAAIKFLRASRAAYAGGEDERAALYYRIGMAHRTIAELLAELGSDRLST